LNPRILNPRPEVAGYLGFAYGALLGRSLVGRR